MLEGALSMWAIGIIWKEYIYPESIPTVVNPHVSEAGLEVWRGDFHSPRKDAGSRIPAEGENRARTTRSRHKEKVNLQGEYEESDNSQVQLQQRPQTRQEAGKTGLGVTHEGAPHTRNLTRR